MTSHNKETLSGYCSQSVPQRAHCYEQKWCHKNDDSRRSLGHQKMNGQERIHQHTSSRNFVLKFFYHQKYEFLGERRNDMIILHANAFNSSACITGGTRGAFASLPGTSRFRYFYLILPPPPRD